MKTSVFLLILLIANIVIKVISDFLSLKDTFSYILWMNMLALCSLVLVNEDIFKTNV